MSIRSSRRRMVAALAAVALGASLALPAASATPAAPAADQHDMQQVLSAVRAQEGAPGAGFTFGDGADDVTLSSGVANIVTRAPIRSGDKVRVGSDTKMFVAAVVLQLVDEGLLELDAPIEQHLPGVLRYPADKVSGDPAAVDGRTVTLRQLLQHTGGLPDYADIGYVMNPIHQVLPPTPGALVRYGLRKGPVGSPGGSWSYSNTGYIIIGMAVEAATGRALATEIRERIAEPLGLTDTFFAQPRQRAMPGSHVRGYLTDLVPLDLTGWEPAIYGAAGALVSSPDDMNTFLSALLAGQVLSPEMLAEMQDDVDVPGGGYGLGLVRQSLSCGDAWGHSGFVVGFKTYGLALPNGRHGFLTINSSIALGLIPAPTTGTANDLFERALCGQ